jgi:hypothetical protein
MTRVPTAGLVATPPDQTGPRSMHRWVKPGDSVSLLFDGDDGVTWTVVTKVNKAKDAFEGVPELGLRRIVRFQPQHIHGYMDQHEYEPLEVTDDQWEADDLEACNSPGHPSHKHLQPGDTVELWFVGGDAPFWAEVIKVTKKGFEGISEGWRDLVRFESKHIIDYWSATEYAESIAAVPSGVALH